MHPAEVPLQLLQHGLQHLAQLGQVHPESVVGGGKLSEGVDNQVVLVFVESEGLSHSAVLEASMEGLV